MVAKIIYDENLKMFHLSNDKISYIMHVDHHNVLTHIYMGEKVRNLSTLGIYPKFNRDFEVNPEEVGLDYRQFSLGILPLEYSGNNSGDFREPSLIIRDQEGSTVNDFRYIDHEIFDGVSQIDGLPSSYVEAQDEAKTLRLYLFDEALQHELVLNYTVFNNQPVIARSAKLINKSDQKSVIYKIASASVDVEPGDYDLLQLNGSWARERMVEREAIHTGIKKLDSKRGSSSHHQNPFIAILDKHTTEFRGKAVGYQLVYSGSHEMTVEKDPYQNLRVQLGIQSTGFEWNLSPEESFQTPEVLIAFSNQGINGLSQSYHDFIKQHIIPRKYAEFERPVLINNWEATYFDFTEEKVFDLVDKANELGIELFVLDDGWFGKRDDDFSSLGDWFEYHEKIPNGLKKIADYVHDKGMKFGLWFEPEMISEESELYKNHPDWVLHDVNKRASRGRSQYVLDMGRQEVRENIYTQMIEILDNIDIDYVKWDMNRNISETYSAALEDNKSGEANHRYILGLYDLLDRITSRYDNILFESCSGGGGRFDLGMLQYMPQVWTSDNTDPIARLKIQYGTSMIAPINTMGAHVSASPNHQTGRTTSIDFRAAVAYAGVYGYELDITSLNEDELASIAQQVRFYKENRALIQTGTFTRLMSPFEGNQVAWSIHNDNKMLLFYFEVLNEASKPLHKIKPMYLDPDVKYLVKYEGSEFEAYGDELMNLGIYIYPQLKNDFSARIFEITAI